MKIVFLSLFLGLVTGPHQVELSVSGLPAAPAAIIELLLDGAPVGRLAGPPWRGKIDLGPELLPHQLTARALDAKGAELARADQWLNLAHPPVSFEILLEGGNGAAPRVARVVWQSLDNRPPQEIALTFDGRRLAVDRDGRATLPAYAPASAHVLSAEVRFPAAVERKSVALGSSWSSEVSTELTAVTVRQTGGPLPPADQLAGWFAAGGAPLKVVAIDETPAELYVVRDPAAQLALYRVAKAARGRQPALRPDDRVRFLWPTVQSFPGKRASELFDHSQEWSAADGSLAFLLGTVSHTGDGAGETRLADAVAVEGLQALSADRRRAVLLVLGGNTRDSSRYTAAAVCRYLAAIHVPLFVWSAADPQRPAAAGAEVARKAAAVWGEVEDVSSAERLRGATERLLGELAAQRVVWLEGLHLPQSVLLTPAAHGIELVGIEAPARPPALAH